MKETLIFRKTPKTCKECSEYDPKKPGCRLKQCKYPAKR